MKKKKSKLQEAKLSMQPYRTNVWLWCCSPEEAKKAIMKTVYYTKYHCNPDGFIEMGGRCFNVEGSNYEPIIWIDSAVPKNQRAINLSHEFLHVINRIFDCRGVIHDPNNDEAWTYMMTYLMTQAKEQGIW